MKDKIHPTYFKSTVTCACGNTFETGSTVEAIHVEICSKCHPFFTGKQKLIDTARRVDRFEARELRSKDIKATHKAAAKKPRAKKAPKAEEA